MAVYDSVRGDLIDIACQRYANVFDVTRGAYSRAKHCGYLQVRVYLHRETVSLP